MMEFRLEVWRAANVHTCLGNDAKHLARGTKAEHHGTTEKQQAVADKKEKVEGEKHLLAP